MALERELSQEDVRREIVRLSPWYYLFELKGIGTDITPPSDFHGHRVVQIPSELKPYFEGKRVLDVGCNEGGYTFSAIDSGAESIEAFDVRPINIEKARFVARVCGIKNATFHVASADSWLDENRTRHDIVLLCGLLYHLPDPWRTIAEYCALAREGLWMTCVLHGGPEGYFEYYEEYCEGELIAANANPSERAMMPNTLRTLTAEFAKHRFFPTNLYESVFEEKGDHGCAAFFRNAQNWNASPSSPYGRQEGPVDIYFAPGNSSDTESDSSFEVILSLYNRAPKAQRARVKMTLVEQGGGERRDIEPQVVELMARPSHREMPPSCSRQVPVNLDLSGFAKKVILKTSLEDTEGGVLNQNSLVIDLQG